MTGTTSSSTPPKSPPNSPLARIPFYYGWVVIAIAFITMGIGVNTRTAFSLLFPPILSEFGWERGVTAGAFSIGFLASVVISPFIGMFMDRYGPRWVISAGVLVVCSGLILATYSTEPWHLHLTLGVLVVGGSVMLSYIGHSFFLPFWFVRKRGLAIGIAFSGVGVGSIILFPWLQSLIDASDWRDACEAMAILLFVALLPLNLLMQRRRPQDLGLEPDGGAPKDKDGQARPVADNVVDRVWVETEWTIRTVVRTSRFWWAVAGFVLGLYAWYAVQVHQTKYLVENGFPADQAALALGFVGLAGIVGQIGIGAWSDHVGREWAWTVAMLGYTVCYALLLVLRYEPSVTLAYLMVASQGLFGYGLASVYGAIPAELFQGKNYGSIFGLFGIASGIGAGGGPWVTGVLYDYFGNYDYAFALAIAFTLLSIFCVWMAGPRKVRLVAGQAARRQRLAEAAA